MESEILEIEKSDTKTIKCHSMNKKQEKDNIQSELGEVKSLLEKLNNRIDQLEKKRDLSGQDDEHTDFMGQQQVHTSSYNSTHHRGFGGRSRRHFRSARNRGFEGGPRPYREVICELQPVSIDESTFKNSDHVQNISPDVLSKVHIGTDATKEQLDSIDEESFFTTDFTIDLKKRIEVARHIANKSLKKAREKQKHHYDVKAKAAIIELGDKVLVKVLAFKGKHKLADKFEENIYEVIDQPHKDIPVYIVRSSDETGRSQTKEENIHIEETNAENLDNRDPEKGDGNVVHPVVAGVDELPVEHTESDVETDEVPDVSVRDEMENQQFRRSTRVKKPPDSPAKHLTFTDEDDDFQLKPISPKAYPTCAMESRLNKGHSAKQFVRKTDEGKDLIGDGSRNHTLPLETGKHTDLKCISSKTAAAVLRGDYDTEVDSVTIIDCRYPYEFNGGHIEGAINIYRQKELRDFMKEHRYKKDHTRNIVIFHCEFSSKRGPNLLRYMRNQDREMNKENYPNLFFPEVYLLNGGYKDFFTQHHELCYPDSYTTMLDEQHRSELSHFRSESKKGKKGSRTQSRLHLRL
ncbi:hypothetical protein ScPMuIL_016285 [Solemya velum]